MAESKMPARIWARDLDGTGSMHPCAKGDPGAVEFIRADLVEQMAAALRFYSGVHEPGLSNPNEGPWGVYSTDFGERARAALSSWEAGQ